jgi:NAD(P)-dependent dehydrogenase (short-subunit alcohol dehydrogenase family)
MVSQGQGGSIIGVSSISALVGGQFQTHYTPTKAGVLSLMQSCACALGKYGIRCNALLPGTIKTQLNEKDLNDDEKRRYMESRIPLGRTGVPSDLAGPAVFLASDLSKYVVSFDHLLHITQPNLVYFLPRREHNYLSMAVYSSIFNEQSLPLTCHLTP